MPLYPGVLYASGSGAVPSVGFLSGAEIYRIGTTATSIATGSFTPHASAAEVVLVVGMRVATNDTITGLTVTIGGVAASAQRDPNIATGGKSGVWMGRWRGAPSGAVSITTIGAGRRFLSIVCYGLSLDTAVVFGGGTSREDNGVTATNTGAQALTTTAVNSLAVFGVATNNDPGAITPDGTNTYTERYEGETTEAGATDTAFTVGTALVATVTTRNFQANWVNSRAWASNLAELKAA